MIMTSRSLLCWALWIFADGDSVRPPISTLQYSHNKPALLELADCPRTLHPRGHMISPEGGRTAQTLLPGTDPPPRGAITRPDTEASHVAVLPGFIFSTPRSLLDFFWFTIAPSFWWDSDPVWIVFVVCNWSWNHQRILTAARQIQQLIRRPYSSNYDAFSCPPT